MHLLIPYIKSRHHDPFFEEFTYGDSAQRARRLKKLDRGTLVFFHTSRHGKKYITAFYVVDRVIDTAEASQQRLIREKYKNPHITEYLDGQRRDSDDAVLFGDPIESRILEKPLLFDRKLAEKLSLKIKFPGNRSEIQAITSATRAWRDLTNEDTQLLLNEIVNSKKEDCDYLLLSSEEVAETLERDIERYITQNPDSIAGAIGSKGLKLVGSQRHTEDGRLDILFKDQNGKLVVVEVKLGYIGREALQQTKNYVRDLQKQENTKVLGLIVCAGVMPAYEDDLRKQKDIRILVYGWTLQIQKW